MKNVRVLSAACLLIFGATTICPAWATDQQDISIALKTLPLLTKKITSPATVAIIYDANSAASKTDAEAIKSIIDGGIAAPDNTKLNPQLTGVSELSRLAGAQMAFLAEGIPASDYGSIGAAAASMGVLTICTDIDCVKANKCVLGITSKPQVEVYYSPAAAEAARISFASAFTMLAKQVGSM